MNDFVRGTVPKVKLHYLPVLCMHFAPRPFSRKLILVDLLEARWSFIGTRLTRQRDLKAMIFYKVQGNVGANE